MDETKNNRAWIELKRFYNRIRVDANVYCLWKCRAYIWDINTPFYQCYIVMQISIELFYVKAFIVKCRPKKTVFRMQKRTLSSVNKNVCVIVMMKNDSTAEKWSNIIFWRRKFQVNNRDAYDLNIITCYAVTYIIQEIVSCSQFSSNIFEITRTNTLSYEHVFSSWIHKLIHRSVSPRTYIVDLLLFYFIMPTQRT